MDTVMFTLILIGIAVGISALGFELYARQRAARLLSNLEYAAGIPAQNTTGDHPQTALDALRRTCEARRRGSARFKACGRKAA